MCRNCQRPYCLENTGSHPNSEVKQGKARIVLGWVTPREVLWVLLAFSTFQVNLKRSKTRFLWKQPFSRFSWKQPFSRFSRKRPKPDFKLFTVWKVWKLYFSSFDTLKSMCPDLENDISWKLKTAVFHVFKLRHQFSGFKVGFRENSDFEKLGPNLKNPVFEVFKFQFSNLTSLSHCRNPKPLNPKLKTQTLNLNLKTLNLNLNKKSGTWF